MENQETKALTDLIQNPSEITNIISDPADTGVKFYKSLPNKDKQYVAFAAGIGLIAYGFYLNRTSTGGSTSLSNNATTDSGTEAGQKTVKVKKKK